MINTQDKLDLVRRVLALANLREISSAREVERIFEDHPVAMRSPVWNALPSETDVGGFREMRVRLRGWLGVIIKGAYSKQAEIMESVVRDFQEKSSELTHILKKDMTGQLVDIPFKTWGVPRLSIDNRLNLRFDADPFLNGVESAVYFGMILLFTGGLTRKVAVCEARKNGGRCGNLYLKTKLLRVACSPECKRTYRSEQVYKSLKAWRRSHPSRQAYKPTNKTVKKMARRRRRAPAFRRPS